MNYTLSSENLATMAKITLNKDERVTIERGSMVYYTGDVELEGKTNGGFFKSIGRALVSGESMFITTAVSNSDNALLAVSSSSIGTIKKLSCGEQQWILNDGVFLASDYSVTYKVVRQKGFSKALFAGSGGFYNMHTEGVGDVLVNSFGTIEEIEVSPSKPLICDNFHVVAWSSNLDYDLRIASGSFGFKTGEGLVIEFKGSGTVYVQSKQLAGFAQSIVPYIPNNN